MPIDFMTCNLLSLPLSHSLALTAQQWPSRSSFQTWQPEQNSQKIGGRTLSLLEQRSARHVLGTLAFTIPSFAVSAATVDRQFWYSKHYVLYIYYILYIIYHILLYILYYLYYILSILYIISYILYIIYYILYNYICGSKWNPLSLSSSFRRLSKGNCALWQRSWKRCKPP